MQVLKVRLAYIGNSNKFNWEYHNLDTEEKGTVQLMNSKEYVEILSVDNNVNKFYRQVRYALKKFQMKQNDK